MRKGQLKILDLSEIRECTVCKERKVIKEFVKGTRHLYRYLCKLCRQKSRRTGTVSETRFKPGHKRGHRYKVGHVPWHAGRKVGEHLRPCTKQTRKSKKARKWCDDVKERDGKKCVQCGGTYMIAAHHIVPWKENESLRFCLENGTTLCNICHGKLEGFQKGWKHADK